MTTAETAIKMVLNSIENKHREQLEMIDALIFVACNDMKNEIDGVVFENPEDIEPVSHYFKALGYKVWRNRDNTVGISWKRKESNMDIKMLYEKSRLNLIPPPPASLSKLTEEERKEIADYIFAKAKQVYDLTIKEAEKEVEKKSLISSKIVLGIIQYVLMFIIFVVLIYLTHRYVPHQFLRNLY